MFRSMSSGRATCFGTATSEAVDLGLLRAGPPSAPSMTAAEAEAARRIKAALEAMVAGRCPRRLLADALAGAVELAEAAGRHRPGPDAGLDIALQAQAAAALPEGAASSTALVHYAVEEAGALAVVRVGEWEAAVPLDVPGSAWLHRTVFAALRAVTAAREETPRRTCGAFTTCCCGRWSRTSARHAAS